MLHRRLRSDGPRSNSGFVTDLVPELPPPDASVWGSSRSAARSLPTAQGQTDNRDTIWGMPATELGDGIFSKNCSLTQSGSLVPKPRRSARCQDEILRARSLQSLHLNYSTLLYSKSSVKAYFVYSLLEGDYRHALLL